jgi:hypothetical protein
MLSVKGIFDWDAVSLYLPFARRIYQVDHIPLTAYDNQPLTIPTGISVLYAWVHSLSMSGLDENFRLFPLLFVAVTMLIIYKIAADFGSKQIAKIAVIVYTLLPLHDAILYYASYYPDLCYNTLILASFFFLCKYIKKLEIKYCLLSSISLGLSALMKPQALYFFPAILFIFASLLKSKLLRSFSTYLLSVFVGLVFIYIAWSSTTFYNALPLTTKVLAFIFVFALTSILAIMINIQARTLPLEKYTHFQILRDSLFFCGTAIAIASLWYVRNYILTGSALWSIGYRNIPNYTWALSYLSATQTITVSNSIGAFLVSLILIPFLTAFLGTFWLVPKLAGTIKQMLSGKNTIIFIWIVGYWLGYFWSVFNPFNTYALNPRDVLPLAPIICFFAAIGLQHINDHFSKNRSDTITILMLMLFGFASLTQSMLIYQYGPSVFNSIANLFGSSLTILTDHYDRSSQALIQYTPDLLYSILIVNLLLFGLILSVKLANKLREHFKVKLKMPECTRLKKLSQKAIVLTLILIIQVVPYVSLTYSFSGGNIALFGENQLNALDEGLFSKILPYLSQNIRDGDVIVTAQSFGLQYYLHGDIRVLDLSLPANLAALMGVIEDENATKILNSIREFGVRYFLLPKSKTPFMQRLSDTSILLRTVKNPQNFILVASSEGWELYEILKTEKLILGWEDGTFVSNWTNIEKYTTPNSSWSFTSNGDILNVTVSGNATVTFQYVGIPSINTSLYHYVAVRVKGTANARWLFRTISNDQQATSYDFPYWWTPPEDWDVYIFDINNTLLKDKVLRPDAYLELRSVDSNPATVYIDYYLIFGYNP